MIKPEKKTEAVNNSLDSNVFYLEPMLPLNAWLSNNVDTVQPAWTTSKKHGVELKSIDVGGCQKDYHYKLRINQRISYIEKSANSLRIELQLEEPCGFEFGGFLDFREDTLLLYYTNFSYDVLKCGSCCYSISYEIATQHEFKVFFLNKKQIFESDQRFIKLGPLPIIEGVDTIGYTDEYGLRDGLYIQKTDTSTISRQFEKDELTEIIEKNNKGHIIYSYQRTTSNVTEKYFNENGTLLRMRVFEESYFDFTEIFFAPNGKVKQIIEQRLPEKVKSRKYIFKRRYKGI